MKRTWICVAILLMLISSSVLVLASASENKIVYELESAEKVNSKISTEDKKLVVAEVDGMPIYYNELLERYSKAVASGESNPYDESLESIARIKAEYRFLEEKGLAVSEKEVKQYTLDQKNLYDNEIPADLKEGIKQIIAALNLTEDEYWLEYKLKENRDFLTHLKAEEYLEAHSMSLPELTVSDVTILENSFQRGNIENLLK
ncbi:hypothetical protein D1155_08635 [Anaerotruncus sp. 80]|uniref:Uncharacterized protein n=1 Tax=Anaerotruncus colihominis TaxID=169435 RepID=A0A845QKX0_9FIRM|nr:MULTISPECIES: hypothetical protein [Anaerotruncus]NBH61715.1 hypothetical protein [Anaerotruncus colihominis]NCF02370.1 hypothetical protein [Anaerotruncus sp. 80]